MYKEDKFILLITITVATLALIIVGIQAVKEHQIKHHCIEKGLNYNPKTEYCEPFPNK